MKHKKLNDQRGIVSIMITMIMMLVISLIVIGFSQVARRNQRETLDRQLSTQAYYAAESGVNVSTPYVVSHAADDIHTLSDGNCTTPTDLSMPTLSDSVSVSCLMLDTQPTTLVANPVSQDSPVIFHVRGANPLTKLAFTWTAPDNVPSSPAQSCTSTNGGATIKLPAYNTYDCAAGIARIDFIDVNSISQANFDNAEANAKTVYFVPTGSGALNSTIDLSAANTNAYIGKTGCGGLTPATGTCDSASSTVKCGLVTSGVVGKCVGIVDAGLSNNYYVRISMLYRDAGSMTISGGDATNQVGGVKFIQGQAVVDSTGKAQDQYRRIQVRIPLESAQTALPLFGLQSTSSICKDMSVFTGIYTDRCVGKTGY